MNAAGLAAEHAVLNYVYINYAPVKSKSAREEKGRTPRDRARSPTLLSTFRRHDCCHRRLGRIAARPPDTLGSNAALHRGGDEDARGERAEVKGVEGMTKKILTIGFRVASDDVTSERLSSKASLLDWDIVLFRPVIDEFPAYESDTYLGKRSLSDTASFRLKEACEHWRREIKQAFENGKTIIVFLPELEQIYIATGERQFSGTGRNQKTTRIVGLYSNYAALPFALSPLNATGSEIKLVSQKADVLAPYWNEFKSVSEYKVIFSEEVKGTSLTTKTGNRSVGAIFRSSVSPGAAVLLPDIEFSPEKFFREREGRQYWTSEAKEFAARLISAVVALDRALRSSTEVTPEPAWATGPVYALSIERSLQAQLLHAERAVEEAQKTKEDTLERLRNAGRLRALLYEKGKPLENGVIRALSLLGFQATAYKQADSEFDVVFESTEGRLLGEAEGKDSKAINVDKLRQLAMNIHEDLQREEVTEPAKGVLFGNGFRLTPPNEREAQFTQKCITAALSSGTALVTTTDLFAAAHYLSDQEDLEYARQCRLSILSGVGPTTLPVSPKPEAAEAENVRETR
jgi:hypothetical protein